MFRRHQKVDDKPIKLQSSGMSVSREAGQRKPGVLLRPDGGTEATKENKEIGRKTKSAMRGDRGKQDALCKKQ